MLKVTDASIKKFDAELDAWFAKTTQRILYAYRGLSAAVFNYVAWETPQWSGSAAANWNIRFGYISDETDMSLKASNTSERGSLSGPRNLARMKFGVPTAQKGDPRAVQIAAARNAGRLTSITGAFESVPVYITNNAKGLSGEAYLQMLEANPNNFLRPVNDPGHMVARGLAKASARFAILSPADEAALKTLKLGDLTNAGLR